MGLVLRRTSKWWYGRYEVHGKEVCKNLRVEVRGQAPASLRETGSVQFENSRGEAQAAFNRLMDEVERGRTNEQLAQAVYEARTGQQVERYDLRALGQVWADRPRKRPPNPKYKEDCLSMLRKFVEFVEHLDSRVVKVDQLREDHVLAFMAALDARGMTNSRWNKYLDLLKGVLRRCGVNVAEELISREEEVIFREPYSVEELHAIFEAARESDPLIYSIAVTAACTAMRKKDCCFLRWADVDLSEGFVSVKTSKTGVEVDIPIADMLREVIEQHVGGDPVFVFPEARRRYVENDTSLSRRLKVVLRLAGFDDGKVSDSECRVDDFNSSELLAVAGELYSGEQLERVRSVLETYLEGSSLRETAARVGVAQSTVSLYLNELEKESGLCFIRGKRRKKTEQAVQRGVLTREREKGLQAASVRDFHSFRTTFVTLALTNGMPMETVRKITGHRTADIVMKHYFRPEREAIRAAMQKTLPGLISSGVATPIERVRELLESMTAGNWEAARDEALSVI